MLEFEEIILRFLKVNRYMTKRFSKLDKHKEWHALDEG